jgi:hypothetical protein
MASFTGQGGVFSQQGIPGPVVIEGGDFPGGGIFVVALRTFFFKRGAMGIGMTIDAACKTKPDPFLFFVAFDAGCLDMCPF